MDERRAEQSAGEPEPDAIEHGGLHRAAAQPEAAVAEEPGAAFDQRIAAPTPGRGGSVLWLALVLVLLVAGVAASPWWAPRLAPLLPWAGSGVADAEARAQLQAMASRLAALEQRQASPAQSAGMQGALDKTNDQLAALDRRVTAIDQQLAQGAGGGSTDGAALAALRGAIERDGAAQAQLADRVAALESKAGAPAAVDPAAVKDLQDKVEKIGADLAALGERVTRLAAAEPDDSRTDQALLLALGQLRQAMQGSGPFTDTLASATALARNRPEVKAALATLSGAAANGVPSLAVLRERFARIAGEIANSGAAASTGWSDRMLGTLGSLVSVRRIGPAAAAGTGPEAAVATAEAALASGDLAGAVTALGTLRGAAAASAKSWLDDARRRLDADAALEKANSVVASRLAQGAAAPPAGTGEPEKHN